MYATLKNKVWSVFRSPYTVADLHFILMVFWGLSIIPTLIWWRESVLWVAFMSLWANIVSHATGYSAAKGQQLVEENIVKED